MSSAPSTATGLLALPLELRQQIYAYLIPRSTFISLPSRVRNAFQALISSVSHRPPSMALLTINRQISGEILDYFYGIATWTFKLGMASHRRQDVDVSGLANASFLRYIKGVELMVWRDASINPNDSKQRGEELKKMRVTVAKLYAIFDSYVDDLRSVAISWVEMILVASTWQEKAIVFSPLKKFDPDRVRVSVGLVHINDRSDIDENPRLLAQALGEVLGDRKIEVQGYKMTDPLA